MTDIILTQYNGAILGPIAKFLGWIMNGVYLFLSNMGIENIGMVANIPADKVKNVSMKRMHNMAMDTIVPPITDFINFEY